MAVGFVEVVSMHISTAPDYPDKGYEYGKTDEI